MSHLPTLAARARRAAHRARHALHAYRGTGRDSCTFCGRPKPFCQC